MAVEPVFSHLLALSEYCASFQLLYLLMELGPRLLDRIEFPLA